MPTLRASRHWRRRELHHLVGLAIQELYADRVTEQYELLAPHFLKAEEWITALDYLLKAAEKAAKAFASREAIALYDQALEAARRLGDAVDIETLMSIHQAKMSLYFIVSNFESSRAEGERLLALAHRAGNRASGGGALAGMGDYDAALATLEEGLALSEKVGDEVQRHRMLNSLGRLHMECGDVNRALDLNRRGAEGARKRGDPETIANPEINLGDIFLAKGDLTLANEFLDGVHRLVKDPATSDWMKWRYSTHLFASLGDLWLARGDYTKARDFCNHCLDLAARTSPQISAVE